MTAKEKAKELVGSFIGISGEYTYTDWTDKQHAKQCALICVDEITDELINNFMHINEPYKRLEFWQNVKQEINNL